MRRLLTSVDSEAINYTTWMSCIVCPEFGVPLARRNEYISARPWASPGQPENSRSDLVESHLAGRRRGEPRITTFEKRVAMPDRKSLVSTLWLTSSLALLASVLVAPIQTSRYVTVSSRPGCLSRNFHLPPGQPPDPPQPSDGDGRRPEGGCPLLLRVKSQERADALDEPRVSFWSPSSFQEGPRSPIDRPLLDPLPLPSSLLIVRGSPSDSRLMFRRSLRVVQARARGMACDRRRRLGPTVSSPMPRSSGSMAFVVIGKERDPDADVRDRLTTTLVGICSRTASDTTSSPLAWSQVGSPFTLDPSKSTATFPCPPGIGTESSREKNKPKAYPNECNY